MNRLRFTKRISIFVGCTLTSTRSTGSRRNRNATGYRRLGISVSRKHLNGMAEDFIFDRTSVDKDFLIITIRLVKGWQPDESKTSRFPALSRISTNSRIASRPNKPAIRCNKVFSADSAIVLWRVIFDRETNVRIGQCQIGDHIVNITLSSVA